MRVLAAITMVGLAAAQTLSAEYQSPSTTVQLTTTTTKTITIFGAKSTIIVTTSAGTAVSTGIVAQPTNGTNPTLATATPTIVAAGAENLGNNNAALIRGIVAAAAAAFFY